MSTPKHPLSTLDTIGAIAKVLDDAGVATQSIGGVIGFWVLGPTGGCWVVELDQPGGRWHHTPATGPMPATSVTILCDDGNFPTAFVDPTTVGELMRAGTLSVHGDTATLRRMGTMLAAAGSLLQLRARS